MRFGDSIFWGCTAPPPSHPIKGNYFLDGEQAINWIASLLLNNSCSSIIFILLPPLKSLTREWNSNQPANLWLKLTPLKDGQVVTCLADNKRVRVWFSTEGDSWLHLRLHFGRAGVLCSLLYRLSYLPVVWILHKPVLYLRLPISMFAKF